MAASSLVFPVVFCSSYISTVFSFFLLFFSSFPSVSQGQKLAVPPAMYMFGDSLVDVGNNNHLALTLIKADFPHNGVDFPGRKATGRFSNGKNAADFLAEKLGLQSPPPYLSLPSSSNARDSYLRGVNFASGGAGVLSSTNKDGCLTLDRQIELFSGVYGRLAQQLGGLETQKHLSQSIIGIVIGSNDLFGYFNSDSDERPKDVTPRQYIDSMVFTLRGQLKRIYNLGARKIVFVGTGPIGCCPSQRLQNKTGDCRVETNHGSFLYNQGVRSLLRDMQSELADMSYSFFDAYTALMEFIQSPPNYEFTEAKAACCGLGNLNAKIACLPISSYCSNRSGHVFWDFYHPTEATSRKLSDIIFDGSQPYVYPVNVRQLAGV